MTDKPTIVVEVRGPQQSGATTLAEILDLMLGVHGIGLDCHYEDSRSKRMYFELVRDLRAVGPRIEVRESDPDDRDTELASLRQRLSRLEQECFATELRVRSRLAYALGIPGEGKTTPPSLKDLLDQTAELSARMRGLEK